MTSASLYIYHTVLNIRTYFLNAAPCKSIHFPGNNIESFGSAMLEIQAMSDMISLCKCLKNNGVTGTNIISSAPGIEKGQASRPDDRLLQATPSISSTEQLTAIILQYLQSCGSTQNTLSCPWAFKLCIVNDYTDGGGYGPGAACDIQKSI